MSGSYGSSDSSSGTTPHQIMLNYSKYLPPLASMTADQISTFVNAASKAGLTSATGTGGQLGQAVASQTANLNPSLQASATGANNAVNQSATTGNAANNIVSAINLNGLSPGEANSVERSLNQTNTATGNLGLINPTNTIANAMNFGGAFNSKIPLAENAVNTALGAANASSTASNAASNAAGANTAAMTGVNNIINPLQTGANAAGSFANQLGTMSAGNHSQSSAMNASGGVSCCFIFMEAYHGEMPWFVRKSRDKYYRKCPRVAKGYKRMAKILVPLMQASYTISDIVWLTMIYPLTKYGGFTHRVKGYECHRNKKAFRNFWFTVWNILGYV